MRFFKFIITIVWGAGRAVQRSDFLFDKYVLVMIAAGGAVNAFAWYYFGTMFSQTSDAFVTLHFTVAMGADLIGEAAALYDEPLFVGVLSLVNVLIARLLYNYDTLLAYVAISALPIMNIAMLANSILLTAVNA